MQHTAPFENVAMKVQQFVLNATWYIRHYLFLLSAPLFPSSIFLILAEFLPRDRAHTDRTSKSVHSRSSAAPGAPSSFRSVSARVRALAPGEAKERRSTPSKVNTNQRRPGLFLQIRTRVDFLSHTKKMKEMASSLSRQRVFFFFFFSLLRHWQFRLTFKSCSAKTWKKCHCVKEKSCAIWSGFVCFKICVYYLSSLLFCSSRRYLWVSRHFIVSALSF